MYLAKIAASKKKTIVRLSYLMWARRYQRENVIWMKWALFNIGLPQLKLSPLVDFSFCSQSKQFNWLNTQCTQFYWNAGDLGAFSSAWLADEHFHSFSDVWTLSFFFFQHGKILLFTYLAKFLFFQHDLYTSFQF